MFDSLGIYSLVELFSRADVRILLWLNQLANSDLRLFKLFLKITDDGSDVLVLATLLLLWFWPTNLRARSLFHEDTLGKKTKREPWLRTLLISVTSEDEYQPVITRAQSRAQVLLFGFGGFTAYIIARLVAFGIDVQRPFESYWPVTHPAEIPALYGNLRNFGTFPSDHAAMLAALACSLYFWNRRLGNFWLVSAVVLAACRVAIGFHYPVDMIGGAVLGVACVWPLLWAYRRHGQVHKLANAMASTFEFTNSPYCFIMYFFVLLAGLEAAKHFAHVLNFIFAVRGDILHRLGH